MRSRRESKIPSPALRSELPYAALLTYSPRGTSPISLRSQFFCYRIKSDGVIDDPPVRAIERAIEALSNDACADVREFLGTGATLIPCPPSAPFPPRQKPALWVPLRICEALRGAGFGSRILPCLRRVEAVPKSAFAAPGERPSPSRHMSTMTVESTLDPPDMITVVDDVVTKGATLLGAASLLARAFPNAEIRAFALVRTQGYVKDIERILDPVVGRISRTRNRGADRQP